MGTRVGRTGGLPAGVRGVIVWLWEYESPGLGGVRECGSSWGGTDEGAMSTISGGRRRGRKISGVARRGKRIVWVDLYMIEIAYVLGLFLKHLEFLENYKAQYRSILQVFNLPGL